MPIATNQTSTRTKAGLWAFAKFLVSLVTIATPIGAYARQQPLGIDTMTTGSIPSQAMLWTVDPTIILFMLLAAFIGLSVTGFVLLRRTLLDTARQEAQRINRPFE